MKKPRLLFAGFTTVDFINKKKCEGGAAAVSSMNASFLGYRSSLLSVLSKDKLGQWYKNKLRNARVDLSLCLSNAPSLPTCVINKVDMKGSERIWRDNGSLPYFEKIKINKSNLNQFDYVFLCNTPFDLLKKIAAYNLKKNIVYVPGPQIVLKKNSILPELYKKSVLVFGNEEESRLIFRSRPFSYNVETVIITKGQKGGTVFSKAGKSIRYSAISANGLVDTTGAGDAFTLGFSLEIIKSNSVRQAIIAGKQLALSVIKKKGGLLFSR